jgi:hypothetical protein
MRDWLVQVTGSEKPADWQKFIERSTLEYWQYVLGGGDISEVSELADAYIEYDEAPLNSPKEGKAQRKLEALLRKYPVSAKRRDIPRTRENIKALVPTFPDFLKKEMARRIETQERQP